jgi:hypothetical protein
MYLLQSPLVNTKASQVDLDGKINKAGDTFYNDHTFNYLETKNFVIDNTDYLPKIRSTTVHELTHDWNKEQLQAVYQTYIKYRCYNHYFDFPSDSP